MIKAKYDYIYNTNHENEIYIPTLYNIILPGNSNYQFNKDFSLKLKTLNSNLDYYLHFNKHGTNIYAIVKKIDKIVRNDNSRNNKKKNNKYYEVYEELTDYEVNVIGDYLINLFS